MRYRSRTDIIASVLQAANGGVTKTKMMYRAFVSHDQLKDYVYLLVENGLLEYEEGKFRTTEKGLAFLKAYDQLDEIAMLV